MRTSVGYAGGKSTAPTYHDLGDHTEAFQLDFDPSLISYEQLLEMFWNSHRPERASHSRQYMAAVFCESPEQARAAEASRARLAHQLGKTIETPVVASARYYLAEDYHQKYYLRHTRALLQELEHYSPIELVRSTVAARLNGYAAGNGSRERLRGEIATLGLSATANAQLEKLVRERRSA